MKKKIIVVLLMQFIANSLFAQLTSLPSSSAFQTTKFSDVNVNESSGRVTTSIPVYNYQVGKLQVPVSLSYVGNGVKVAQQSNWVGTNWNLNAGGVITRIVNGYPDEKASVRLFLEDLGDPATIHSENYILQPGDTRDYRADIFSFSFPGYSGSFYLDKTLTPRLTNNDSELRIEFLGGLSATNTNTIVITTPTGVKYFFGGANASENSSTLIKTRKIGPSWMADNSQILQTVTPLATTAFYLYKIENNYGDQILIDYHDDGVKDFILFEQQRENISTKPVNEACTDIKDYLKGLQNSVFHGSIHNSKKISRIYSSNSNIEIKFNSDPLVLPSDGVIPTPQYNDRILKNIQVYNTLISQNVKIITLDYLLPAPTNALRHRFFLEKVSVNNSNLSTDPKCEVYKMEYNSPEELPSRFSYNVDLMGYYNGASNASFIDHDYYSAYQTTNDLTVRDPNFEYATKGVLKKMYYPSGGYTSFEYERPYAKANTVKNVHLRVYQKIIQEAVPHQSPAVYETKNADNYNVGADNTPPPPQNPYALADDIAAEGPLTTGFPPVTIYKDCKLKVILNRTDNTAHTNSAWYGQPYPDYVTFTVTDLTTNIQEWPITYPYTEIPGSFTSPHEFNLKKDHKYSFSLVLTHGNTHNVSADAFLEFEASEYLPASGIRIKRVTELAGTQQVKTKRYYYKKAKDIGKNNDDSGVVITEPKLDTSWDTYGCSIQNAPESYDAVSLIVNPFAHIFGGSDNQIEYRYVTTSFGGDAFELGGIEKHFKIEKNDEIALFYKFAQSDFFNPDEEEFGSCSTNNKNQFNGTLLREVILEKKGTGLFVKEDKEFIYDLTIDHEIKNFVVATTYQGLISPFDDIPCIGQYSTFSYRNNLKEIISKTYTTPVLVVSNPVLPDFIKTKTNFEYTALRGLPSKIITTDSKGKTLTKRLYYPVASNVSLLSGLSAADVTNYSVLESQNNISSPIQVENYSKDNSGIDKLLFTQRSIFKNFSGKLFPYTQQEAKANSPLFSNVFVSDYDTNGNPVEVTQENQFKKSTLYGYKNQAVIAELPNVAYADIPPGTIATLKSLSDNVVDQASMNAFETQLNTLRSLLPNAQITTYVYNPTGQLDSVTDARGRKTTYVYDDCKRLKMIKDNEGNIMEEYKYNLLNN